MLLSIQIELCSKYNHILPRNYVSCKRVDVHATLHISLHSRDTQVCSQGRFVTALYHATVLHQAIINAY